MLGQTKHTVHGLSAVASAVNYIMLVLLTIQKVQIPMCFKSMWCVCVCVRGKAVPC